MNSGETKIVCAFQRLRLSRESWPIYRQCIFRRMFASHRVMAALMLLIAYGSLASAQSNPSLYVAATLTGYVQPHSYQPLQVGGLEPLGGNGWGGSVLVGGW